MLATLRKYKVLILLGLFVATILIWWHVAFAKGHDLTVAFLDIGQGDAIYMEAPNGKQILIDGGKDRSVLAKLGEVMPLGDHSIDVVIATHPDADHIGGLPFILDNYTVGMFMEPGVEADTKTYLGLEEKIKHNSIPKVLARRGMKLILDDKNKVSLEILFPDNQDVSHWETNAASIVAKLSYGAESFIFTGDAPQATEQYLIALDGAQLKTNVLKLGHHGSRTSSSEGFLQATDPDYAIVSAGRNNSYGHPHKEVLDLLTKLKIPYLETAKKGTIIFRMDGETLELK